MTEKPRLLKRVLGAIRKTAKRATTFGLSRFVYGSIGGLAAALSSSGITVDIEQSLQNSSYFRAVNLLANAVGKTDFVVKAGADEVKGHPANPLVKFWARHHQLSSDMFRRVLMVHAMLYGNGYARIVRHKSEPVKLVILNPRYVVPEFVNGELWYRLNDPANSANDRRISPSSIIHIKAFTLDGVVGLDPIRYWASETLGLAIATQKYAASYYENGGQPRAYLHSEHPLNADQWQTFETKIAPTLNSDLHNPHRMPLLEQMDIKSTGLDAQATQLLESRKQSMLEIANMLGIPPHKLGLTQSSAYKSLEEENKAFREDAVEPWLCQFEVEYRKLLTEDQQATESHRIEANRFDLSKTDIKSRFEALSKATGGAAFLTPNDARKTMGEDDHPDGDTLHKPPTNETKDKGEGGEPKADDDETDEDSSDSSRGKSQLDHGGTEDTEARLRELRGSVVTETLHRVQALSDVYARMTKRLAVEAQKRSTKSEQWPDYLEQLSERHASTLRAMLEPIVPLCGGRSEDAGRITDELLTTFKARMADIYDTATRDDFPAAVSQAAEGFQSRAPELARNALLSFAV